MPEKRELVAKKDCKTLALGKSGPVPRPSELGSGHLPRALAWPGGPESRPLIPAIPARSQGHGKTQPGGHRTSWFAGIPHCRLLESLREEGPSSRRSGRGGDSLGVTRAASGLSTGSSIQDRGQKACRNWGAGGSLQPLGDKKEPVIAFLSPDSQGPHIVPTAHPVPALPFLPAALLLHRTSWLSPPPPNWAGPSEGSFPGSTSLGGQVPQSNSALRSAHLLKCQAPGIPCTCHPWPLVRKRDIKKTATCITKWQ